MRLRHSAYARAALLTLALISLGGCKVLGMRSIPLDMLEDEYEKPNSRYMEIDGVRMHYTKEGKGPPVLLLHGVRASLHTWDGWVPLLKENFTVIRVDIPGFGLSESFADDDKYTPEYAVEFIEKARKKFGYEKMHIVGNSLGGFLAWYYATKFPERVEKLVLIDPASYPQDLPFIIGLASGHVFGAAAQLSSPRFIVKRNIRKVYGNPDNVSDETIDRYHALLLREGHRHSMVQYFRVLKKYADTEELVQHIPEIKAPTLLMWGEKDRWVPSTLIERWQHDLPQLELKTYPEAGHIPMEEYPEETARDAFAFLADGAELPDGAADSRDSAQESTPKAKAKPTLDDPEAGDSDTSGGEAQEADEAAAPAPAKASHNASLFDSEE
jgi:pimeloyl-ACP methyl ester carboxylesterase